MNRLFYVLLVADNAPSGRDDDLLKGLKFLPTSSFCLLITTQLLQPVDKQGKKLDIKAIFEHYFVKHQSHSRRILEISLLHRRISQGDRNVWESVTKSTLTSAWKKFWPEIFVECHFETISVEACSHRY
ncbi:hypothetical protein NPIL_645671 [Nephila pilipes]|uniref:Uncharacterized protein n=1 Tax=Nephila pilipes TaxID=299642 RepID=A0A8X6P3D0_NEPPI|nr:hypothetical protein NPIL_645671 [Nephila pilipes]